MRFTERLLEADNSSEIIKKDYLDLVTREDAEKFWNIRSAAAAPAPASVAEDLPESKEEQHAVTLRTEFLDQSFTPPRPQAIVTPERVKMGKIEPLLLDFTQRMNDLKLMVLHNGGPKNGNYRGSGCP